VSAQATAIAQTFEVASVKKHVAPLPAAGGSITLSGSRITIEGFSVGGFILYAYGIRVYQLSNSAQLDHTMYDLVADVGDGRKRTREEFQPYIQRLLADRFKMQLHWEERQMPVYALVVSKAGVKFKPARNPAAEPKLEGRAYNSTGRGRELTWTGATMEQFADLIRNRDGLDRLVLDQTGLTGQYDIKVAYVAQNRMTGPPLDVDDVDIFTALPNQLGLTLVPTSAQVKVLIVDHCEVPSEN
jgi:uncharacterized protein (TIGR03435 family)